MSNDRKTLRNENTFCSAKWRRANAVLIGLALDGATLSSMNIFFRNFLRYIFYAKQNKKYVLLRVFVAKYGKFGSSMGICHNQLLCI